MKINLKPYRVRHRSGLRKRLYFHNWSIEYWDGDDHSFKSFMFRRSAVRWASKQDGIR